MKLLTIIIYQTSTQKKPFSHWFDDLEIKAQAIVLERLQRLKLNNLGDCKLIKNGNGIWELRIFYGPGYRIYFGKSGNKLVVLLIGGDKGSQDRDITKAKRYWQDYKDTHEKNDK